MGVESADMRFGLFIPQGWRLDLVGIPTENHWATMRDLAQCADGEAWENFAVLFRMNAQSRLLEDPSKANVVGVALDTMRQMESHLLMRHYDGFLKKGRVRGRI